MFERAATTTDTLLPFPSFHVERYAACTGEPLSAIEGYSDPNGGQKTGFPSSHFRCEGG